MAQRRLLSIVNREQLRRVLQIMLDEQEFMSGYGIRASRNITATIPTPSP